MRLLKSLLVFSIILFTKTSHAQDSASIKWESSFKKISDKEYEIKLKGDIKNGWHLYTDKDDAEGLAGTTIAYDDSSITKAPLKFNTTYTVIEDPVFDKKEKNVATGPIE